MESVHRKLDQVELVDKCDRLRINIILIRICGRLVSENPLRQSFIYVFDEFRPCLRDVGLQLLDYGIWR